MTPKELEIFYATIEHISEVMYKRGFEDAKAGKTLENKGFSLSRANRLTIKTNLIKSTEKR